MTKPRLDQGPDYERGFIDGMQHQMQSSVDRAVNRMAQPKQEPVGVVALDTSRPFVGGSYNGQVMPWSQAPAVKTVVMFKDLPLNTPLYTTPPQREWVGLTHEDVVETWDAIIKYAPGDVRLKEFAQAIETKLKEKNT